MSTDVEFSTADGTVLRGWCRVPDGVDADARVPGVVMAHGFSAVKEMGLGVMADALVGAGFAVLAYDHRNLGASDGAPRQEIDIWAQARDYRAAFDRLAAEPAVDPARVALWGTSFSGGEVLVVGAADPRVAAVVTQVPFAGLAEEVDDADGAAWAAMVDALLHGADVPSAPATGPMKVAPDAADDVAMLPQPESVRWFAGEAARAPAWRNECTVRFGCGDITFDPGLAVAHLAPTPLLMIVASEDRVAPVEIALASFARAGEPKELAVLDGDHFVGYAGDGFARARDATVAFLRRHLGG